MQKLIAGALAAASVVGAVAVTTAPTVASAQPYYGYHHRYWHRHYYHPYYHHRFYRHGYYR